MFVGWLKHLKNDTDRDRFHNTILSARPVLERLSELADEKIQTADNRILSTESYDNPNWALKAADRNGYIRAISEIKQIINLDQQKEYLNK